MHIPITLKKRLHRIYKNLCKLDKEIRIIFYTSKIRDYFSTKDLLPKWFKSSVVYQYSCARCGSCYVGRTHKHLATLIEEHLGSIFKHLRGNPECQSLDQRSQFKILDYASSQYELSLKEGLHIKWLKPNLNVQKNTRLSHF